MAGFSVKRFFALFLCALLAVGGCISPAIAAENEKNATIQEENAQSPYAQYISYYSDDTPAGSDRDYKDDKKITRGNVEWDVAAINGTVSLFASIIAEPLGAPLSWVTGASLGAVAKVQNFITENAPQSKDCTYVMTSYRNNKISFVTSEYYKHSIVYTVESNGEFIDSPPVVVYETRSFVS